jgi:hypothetical protein
MIKPLMHDIAVVFKLSCARIIGLGDFETLTMLKSSHGFAISERELARRTADVVRSSVRGVATIWCLRRDGNFSHEPHDTSV